MNPEVPAWADIQPKVTASALAYAFSTATLAVMADVGIEVSAVAGQACSGFVMLLFAYLMPSGRHRSRAGEHRHEPTQPAAG